MVPVMSKDLLQQLTGAAPLGEDQGLPGNFLNPQGGAFREGMPSRNHYLQFVLVNRNHLQVFLHNRQSNDSNIDLIFRQLLQDFMAEIPIDADSDLRVRSFEFRENLRQDIKARSLVGPNNHLSGGSAVRFAHALERFAV